MTILVDKQGRMLTSQFHAYTLGPKRAKTVVVDSKAKVTRKRQRSCAECGSVNSCWTTPMLKTSVWLTIAGKRDILCFECTETRLGREITIDDLSHTPGNYGFHKLWERQNNEH